MIGVLKTAEQSLNRIFPTRWNPLYNLGSLSFYLFAVVAVTGLYLFIFFDTSVANAYQSVESITSRQYYVGSLIRSLHRYASSLMAVTVTLHLLKELIQKRYLGSRWFSWITGVPLLWLLFASAIGGYWLVWDQKAQYISLLTADLMDSLPIITEPMLIGFADSESISDRFFTLLIFMHVGLPLALLLGMIIHIKRIKDARIQPPAGLTWGITSALVVLSILFPAASMAPANFDEPLRSVEIDWFYMNTYPLISLWGPVAVGLSLLGLTAILLLVPLVPVLKPSSAKQSENLIAVVDPDFCNGCGWCAADCPYEAIYLKSHDYKLHRHQAVVVSDFCVGCGICAGACPSVTPFKHHNEGKTGIELSHAKNSDFLLETRNKTAKLTCDNKILVIGCHHGADLARFESDDTTTLSLECIGQLPPSYLDYLCRREGVEAVLLTGCTSGNCHHRSGIDIQEQRLVKSRDPHLRYPDVKEKLVEFWTGNTNEKSIEAKIAEIRDDLELKS